MDFHIVSYDMFMLCLGIFRTCFTWKVSLSPPLCRLRCCFFNPPGLGSLAPNLRLSKSEGIDGIAGGELIWIQLSPDKIWRNTKTSWQEDSKDVDEHLVLWVSFSLAHFHAYDWNWLDLSKLYWIYFFVCALAFCLQAADSASASNLFTFVCLAWERDTASRWLKQNWGRDFCF